MEKLKKEEGSLKKVKTGLEHPSELILAKELIKLPDLLEEISQSYEVHRLPFYSIEIAKKFHEFYAQCKVIDEGNINEGLNDFPRSRFDAGSQERFQARLCTP